MDQLYPALCLQIVLGHCRFYHIINHKARGLLYTFSG